MTLKIWHLLSNRWNSAITEYALSAARGLAGAGHQCTFSALVGSPADARARQHLTTRPVPGYTIAELRLLRLLAEELLPDVIITYGGPEAFLAKVLRRVSAARVVRFRGQELTPNGFAATTRYRLAHSHIDLLLAPSQALADQMAAASPDIRCLSVPLGVDAGVFQRRPPLLWPPQERPELVVLGRLDPVKGHGAMLRMMAELLAVWGERQPRPMLHIIGEPANLSAAHMRQMAEAVGLRVGEDIRVTAERVADLPLVLSSAALGVVPSLGSELICRVAEEFLLCGTPVAVSGVGSLAEVLAFPQAGFSWGGLDAHAAVERLGEWLGISLGETAATKLERSVRARSYFTIDVMGAALSAALS